VRERGAVVDGEGALVHFLGLRRFVHLTMKEREAHQRLDALRGEFDGVREGGESLLPLAEGKEHRALQDMAFDVVRVFG
jgi:hypothetical protein